LALLGCGDHQAPPAAPSSNLQATAAEPDEAGGAELWAENCSRCHNIRPPRSFSAAQWEVIVHHMRLRADLTGTEARQITQFLQASN
jgi:hypothetical protein